MDVPAPVTTLAEAVAGAGGRLYVVGGGVRDWLLGRSASDVDLEVHGLDAEALDRVLASLGTARRVGKVHPVHKLPVPGLGELDVSMPRLERPGTDSVTEAARHRDLTINALLFDPLSREVLDPWGGRADLERGRLAAVDPDTFVRDPLRALRVAGFAARLGFTPCQELVRICRGLDLRDVPAERIREELIKLLQRSTRPSVGFRWIRDLGQAESVLPGVVWTDDDAAAIDRVAGWRGELEEAGLGPYLALCWSVLLVDHPDPEALLARIDLHRIGRWRVRQRILSLLEASPSWPETDADVRALGLVPPAWLALRWCAARDPSLPLAEGLAALDRYGLTSAGPPDLLSGKDLVALGVDPGEALGELLARLRQAWVSGEVRDPEGARTWVLARIGCAVEDDPAP